MDKATKQLLAEEFIKLIGDDEDDYQSPNWQVPHITAEMLIAHAEGWDNCKQTLRDKVRKWKEQ